MQEFIDKFSAMVRVRYKSSMRDVEPLPWRSVFYFDLADLINKPGIDKAFIVTSMEAINLNVRYAQIGNIQQKCREKLKELVDHRDVLQIYIGGDVVDKQVIDRHETALQVINRNFGIWANAEPSDDMRFSTNADG